MICRVGSYITSRKSLFHYIYNKSTIQTKIQRVANSSYEITDLISYKSAAYLHQLQHGGEGQPSCINKRKQLMQYMRLLTGIDQWDQQLFKALLKTRAELSWCQPAEWRCQPADGVMANATWNCVSPLRRKIILFLQRFIMFGAFRYMGTQNG